MAHAPRWNTEIDEFIYKATGYTNLVGLESIPEKEVLFVNDKICIPKRYSELGSIYYRKTKALDLRQTLSRYEDFLNFHLDLLLSIASDDIINKLVLGSLEFNDTGPWSKYGLLSLLRLFELGEKNVAQPDGFFVSDRSIIGVEIKLAARTSPKQLLAYIAVAIQEENLTGERDNLGLLYLVPKNRKSTILDKAGAAPDGTVRRDVLNHWTTDDVRKILTANPDHTERVCDRFRVSVLSWSEMNERISKLVATLGETPAELTLRNLVEGFADQLRTQEGTKVGVESANRFSSSPTAVGRRRSVAAS